MTRADAELLTEATHPAFDPHAVSIHGGAIAMVVTYGIGRIAGTTI
jgi:hypothetical protein